MATTYHKGMGISQSSMTFILSIKAAAVWFIIALLAIANGVLREYVLQPLLGINAALPLSGFLLSVIIFFVTYLVFSFFGKQNAVTYLLIGGQWLLTTLLFEFILGHYIYGQSWWELLQVFNVLNGNLFIIVLISSLVSPYSVARIKGAL